MNNGPRTIDPRVIEGFRQVCCACVGDVLGGLGLNGIIGGLAPLDRKMKLCGPAVTMRQIASRDRRNWARHEKVLVEMTRPGDVFVIDAGGRMDASPWGGNVTYESLTRGLEGTVIDGVTRDSQEIIDSGYPVFTRGVTLSHAHGLFHSTCLNNEPVQIGVFPRAVLVAPGDLIMGEADGLVVVPAERAKEILELAQRRHEGDMRFHELMKSGKVHGDPEVNAQVAKSRALEGVEQAEDYKW